ncbi:hypothetical protein [Streptomyces sp. NPDC088789]|uniref:hypothetical protein n=1 Tax=Streptomyces sp. NPDC088789 TaxID=3365899 RepID=UPI0038036C91
MRPEEIRELNELKKLNELNELFGAPARDEKPPEPEPEPEPAAAAAPRALVLSAERGIINTGTVHGGQHHTTVESAEVPRPVSGADGGR